MEKIKSRIIIILLALSFAQSSLAQQNSSLKALKFLHQISGSKIVAGQHNDQKFTDDPAYQTNKILEITGLKPGLWGGDFSFDDRINKRWKMIYEAERQYKSGAIVNLMFHACPPTLVPPCDWDSGIKSKLTDEQWSELITAGSILNTIWKSRLDEISVYLQYLKDKDVEVLWRPFHEMNQKNFWWGGRKGPNGTRKLYQLTYDYLMQKKLTNLVWCWNMQDLSMDWDEYNPGEKYWDVLTFDIYGSGYEDIWYKYALKFAGTKPLAIGETNRLPSPEILKRQSRYIFFMGWGDLTFSDNTSQQIKTVYKASMVLTIDKMPGWSHP
jgi:mannan endo-1,4-beta-mannosidase